MTNGNSQGIFVIIALVIFGIFCLISYILFRDTMKPSLARIYCDAFTITSKNTGFGSGICSVDNGDKISRTYYKIRDASPEKNWSEVWVLVEELDNGHVEIIDSGNKDQFTEGDLGNTLIGDIRFPDTVGNGLIIENIGHSAFKNAKFENVMRLPSELIILDDYSLQQSHFSGEARFPENLEIIGIEALRDSRFSGELPEMPNIKEIGDNAFKDSEFEGNLPSLPNAELIGEDAFKNSKFTGSFNGIGSNVGTGGSGAGNGSGSSGSNSGGSGNSSGGGSGSSHGYGSDGGIVISDGAFENSKFTGKPNIPSNVSIIGDNAFKNSDFTEIDFKDNTELIVIGDNAFENSNLAGILYLPDSVKYIGNKAFYSSKFINRNWILPKKLEYIGDYAFYNSIMQGDLTMKENLTHIGNYAFYNSYSDVIVTDRVGKSYGENTASVNKRYTLNLTNSLEYIGHSAFEKAVFTGNFEIPTNTKFIGDNAFANSFRTYAVGVKYVRTETAPNGWSWKYDFYIHQYTMQPTFKFNENIEYIGANAFYNAHFKDISTIVPTKLHTIGTDAFKLAFGTQSKTEFKKSSLTMYESKRTVPYNTQTIKVGKTLTSHNLENIEVVE
ncbi:TPA: leucine-rich repeat protein [Enterococcus faecium]|uniref:leucine-rich repeat domain-containing protein n=1 Tax=Enterococcus faecium TaxID=1352 RepID=UPI003740BC88|nr:leucine-rich repeat domain-containing protein [Enterococcus faecium]HCK2017842.1 leucine-rich repeat protein [Enterococcus faecium]